MLHNHSIEYSYIIITALVILADYCMIVALLMLDQAPLVLAFLVVSLASVATKATFMARESTTVFFWMISEQYKHS